MDQATSVADQIEDLEANIDDLTTALHPVLTTPLTTQTSTLPLLDKAKLYILHAYAIESLLFSALQASGADAKAHPIFKELARLKTYFKKIKDAELGTVPTTRLDKGAAGRFIRAGLAGNDRFDKERAERVARERARAKLLQVKKGTKKRFDSEGEEIVGEPAEGSRKRKAPEAEAEARNGGAEKEVDSENAEMYGVMASGEGSMTPSEVKRTQQKQPSSTTSSPRSQDEHQTKKTKHSTQPSSTPSTLDLPKSREERKAERRAEKAARKLQKAQGYPPHKPEELLVPKKDDSKGPRTHSETFKALLEGPLPKRTKGKKGKDKDKGK
ncbi:hypothetical protein BDV96DRAFT_585316 [Lophiotrema nucula]|uniref:Exosome complex protein n=1 Tax=Lophiotrema nucula TaxID=690887 RepID=A0A6A5YUK0_9PLEO|nr:hypothetical protein BDV96DRAFT_585316 [Lophiotrema nucula]